MNSYPAAFSLFSLPCAALDTPPAFLLNYEAQVIVQNVPFVIKLLTNASAIAYPNINDITISLFKLGTQSGNLSDLPYWITFEQGATYTVLSGIAPASELGSHSFSVRATGLSLSAFTTLSITVLRK
jgi:hypothetical protein